MSSWNDDLAFGKKYEDLWVNILNGDYDYIERAPDKKFSDWDIKIVKDNIEITYEIKADRLTAISNNIAIEFEHRGNKSGIAVSRAKYWIIFCVDLDGLGSYNIYKIPRKDLIRKFINNGNYKCIKENNEKAKFVLIETKYLKDYLYKVVYNDGFLSDD